jgi:hypothetical protein
MAKSAMQRTLEAIGSTWKGDPGRQAQGLRFVKKAKKSDRKRKAEKASRKRNR